ncbi:hypothetical protein AB5J62_32225 [Amycolatopsis sp. cg5]|uniref:hypothetical protein n=1 Tax=Amycolatopsis sp. cg5 TaxID=3238802 RepID=UPI003523367F
MNFAIGVFDLFTYTIPGALYLALFGYVGARFGWIDPAAVGRAPVVLLVIALVLVTQLLGYLGYPLGAAINRLVTRRRDRRPRQEFLRRNPEARDRAYVEADPHLLLSVIQLHDKDVAVEVSRLRATGLMLRNSAPPLLLGALVAVVEIFTGSKPALAAVSLLLFAVGSVSLVAQGRKMGHWASIKTLELCFWIPDIDERLARSEEES